MSSATFDYDRSTDALYIKLRARESVDNEVLEDGDVAIDIGADGAPPGYEIQGAPTCCREARGCNCVSVLRAS